MKIAFYITAAVMIAVALAAVLLPLLRHGSRSARPRSVFALTLAIALALPLATAALYLRLGTPAALDGVTTRAEQPTLTLPQAISALHAHLAKHPDDVQAWLLLAQTSSLQQNPAAARDAYDHVLKLDPNNADAMVGWAETDSMLRSDHLLQGRAMDLLKRAVLLQPDSQRGLWLLGIGDFQAGDYRDAAATWRVLQPQLEPGSKVAEAVAAQIAMADSRASSASAGASGSAAAATPRGATLRVQVALAPALRRAPTLGRAPNRPRV